MKVDRCCGGSQEKVEYSISLTEGRTMHNKVNMGGGQV